FGVKEATHGFLEEVSFPADPNRRSGEIREKRRFQQTLKVDRAVIAIRAQRPHKLRDFFRASNAGAVTPLIGVDRNQTDVETAQFDHGLILALDQPVNRGFRKSLAQLRYGRQAMDDIAQRAKLNHEKSFRFDNLRSTIHVPAIFAQIVLMTSRLE